MANAERRSRRTLSEDAFDATYRMTDDLGSYLTALDHPEYVGDARAVRRYPVDLRDALRRAERFTLDDDFVRRATALGIENGKVNPDLVGRAVTLARAPFRTVWLEWDAIVMLAARVVAGTMPEVAGDAPRRLGSLIEAVDEEGTDWRCRCIVDSPANLPTENCLPALMTAFVRTEDTWDGVARLRRSPDGSRLAIDGDATRCGVLFGAFSMEAAPNRGLRPEKKYRDHPVLRHVMVDVDEIFYAAAFAKSIEIKRDILQELIVDELIESRGFLRFVVFSLALINTSVTSYVAVPTPPGRRIGAGRSLPYLSRRTVTIRVPPGVRLVEKFLTKTLDTEHRRRRAHRVRGHWREAHLWRGRLRPRAWVPAHQRGDASLGFVDQYHIVKAE